MNQKQDQTDSERPVTPAGARGSRTAKTQQDEMPDRRQERADDEPRRQQGGWTTEEDGRGGSGDSDSGEKLVDEP